jgi:superfamily II DNA or RNA helicase
MDQPILVLGEKPQQEANPSQHPEFRRRYPVLFAPLQTEAYRRVREGRSCALVAPTSSGKTLAVAAPLFEARRPAVFVLPFRALILDQSQELVRIAKMFGIPETAFAAVWGGTSDADIAEAVRREYILITPDKLVSLFVAGRKGNAAALSILSKYDFVFDEVHIYNAMMLTSLLYFLRSVRYWQELGRHKSGFYFLSATFPPETWQLLQAELGLTDDDRIEGISYTGNVRLLVKPAKTVTKTTEGDIPIVRDMEALDITRNTVGIFNSAYRAWEVSRALDGGLLFIGQDKMREAERRRNFNIFRDYPEDYALIGSPAIEAGVDFTAANLVIEESYQDSFVQRFGRAARSGKDAFVLAYSDQLYDLFQRGMLAPEYTRQEFLEELRNVTERRQSRRLFTGLAAYAYYSFWNDPGFPMEPDHLKLCERLKRAGVDNTLAFRSLTPYTHYDSGESISFKTLFRKALPLNEATGKARGSPHPELYYTLPKRAPVYGEVIKVADKEQLSDDSTVILARVRFSHGLGTYWVLLEMTPPTTADDEDDNMRLKIGSEEFGRREDGGAQGDLLIRFYDVDM